MSTALSFDEMLAAAQTSGQEAFDAAPEYNDWVPPDNLDGWNCLLGQPRAIPFSKDGKSHMMLALPHEIIDGPEDVKGKTFEVLFSSNNGISIRTGAGLAKLLTGQDTSNFGNIMKAIHDAAEGKAVKVAKKSSVSKKNGQTYVNYNYLDKLQVS